MDFRKTFDLVWRDALWYKMLESGINGNVINVMRNMYPVIKSCVSLNQELADYFASFRCEAEENLSPLLFSLDVNDTEELLRDG